MKKALSLVITFVMAVSVCVTAAATKFSDLPENHWAYQNVLTLVNDGTVNGYTDGTFQPSKTVTRAEFVKMIGKWDRAYEGTITDLSTNHWGYEYLIWSGLEPEGNQIFPDKEILRSEVINLIWKRNGSPKSVDAPAIITKQGTNTDATSWAYTIGLIQGDDGLNLRLNSPLTRAEAATLIVRSRALVAENRKNNFKDVISNELIETIYLSVNLFPGKAYDANATVTNAEVAHAAMLLGAGGAPIVYDSSSIDTTDLIDHTYTKDLHILAHHVWGSEFYTLEMADKPATKQEVVSALIYGLLRRGGRSVAVGNTNGYYSDCVAANSTALENLCLTYASQNGIRLTAGTTLGATETATMRDVACLLLLIDDATGLELGYSGDYRYNKEINKNLATYPSNYKDFHAVLEGVPAELYTMKNADTKPVSYYERANQLSFVFNTYLSSVKAIAEGKFDGKMHMTYLPSLCYEEDNHMVFVAECYVSGNSADLDVVFGDLLKTKTGKTVETDKTFYVVFETYEPLMDIFLPKNAAYISNIIIPE